MLGTLRVRPVEGNEPLYQVIVSLGAVCDAEPAVRELVERHRGELKQLRHETHGRRARLHLYLGRPRAPAAPPVVGHGVGLITTDAQRACGAAPALLVSIALDAPHTS